MSDDFSLAFHGRRMPREILCALLALSLAAGDALARQSPAGEEAERDRANWEKVHDIAKSGVGFGAEFGLGGPKDHFGDSYAGVFSPDGYCVFKTSNEKVQPFVTGGYTRTFGHDSGHNWGNFGAGVAYWAASRVGLLIEFRDHVTREQSTTIQICGIRLGVAFK